MYLGCASDTHNFVIRQKRLSEPLHTMAPSPPLWTITHQGCISSSEPHSHCSPSVSLSLGSISFHLTHTRPYVLLWFLYSTQCGVVECHASHNIGFFWKLISVYASFDCVGCDADGGGCFKDVYFLTSGVPAFMMFQRTLCSPCPLQWGVLQTDALLFNYTLSTRIKSFIKTVNHP